MESEIKKIGSVVFPKFTGERAYQIPIRKNEPLPFGFSRWQNTVDDMLKGVDTDGEIYLTIDQGFVVGGDTQRRAGPHIDGNWEITGHSTGHRVTAWNTGGGSWNLKNLEDGGIIVASSCDGAKIYQGEFDGIVGDGGDCSHIDLSGANTELLKPDVAYLGNVTMIHEAVPANQSGNRSFVRLTLPHNYKFAA